MSIKEKTALNGRRTTIIVICVFLLICIAMGFLCYGYYGQLQSTLKNESSGYLQEISKQIGSNASRTIKDNFAVLETVSTVLKNSDVKTYEEFQPVALSQQDFWNYQNIMLIDNDGNAYDAFGNIVQLSSDEYLREVLVEKKRVMSSSQVLNGKESTVFAIPLDGVTIDNIEMGALAASYDLSTFDKVLDMTAFDGRAYAHIIRRDGAVVVRSSSDYAPQSGYNILSSLGDAKMDAGYSMEQTKEDIARGKTGIVTLTLDGVHQYMSYTPLDTEEWYLLTFVPVEVVNAKSEMLMKLTLLLCGIIVTAFAALFVALLVTFFRHKRNLERIAYVDPVTDGNTAQRFGELSEELLRKAGNRRYALVYTNVQKFKIMNEQFGRAACDQMLRAARAGIEADMGEDECVGRWYADHICAFILYEDKDSLLRRFEKWYDMAKNIQEREGCMWLAPVVEIGVYVVKTEDTKMINMVDCAKISMREGLQEYNAKMRYSIYDDEDRRKLLREKHLEDIMDDALANDEFRVYLQPKYATQTETIGGAEALARWESKEEGMIYPDEFIPVFEKSGFIVKLDLWIFEQVCAKLRRWIDAGQQPVKISVNCSRMHLKRENFLERYCEICARYHVPPHYLEIELTETVVFEDTENLIRIIDEIHSAGFGCSMDDFGSGYSSLNVIQDIPVDTLKLDKAFFRKHRKDEARMESVIGSVLTMAKSLNMETVAEGVEKRVQVEMLKRLGCDYIQGYYFAKPMPVMDFEMLFFGKSIEDAEGDIEE